MLRTNDRIVTKHFLLKNWECSIILLILYSPNALIYIALTGYNPYLRAQKISKMSLFNLILIFFSGLLAIFAFGCLIGHITRLDRFLDLLSDSEHQLK